MADQEDLAGFIKTHFYGTPAIKPDEKRKFLGNFKERVALAVTVAQLRDDRMFDLVKRILENYRDYRVYLNEQMGKTLLNRYLKLAITLNYPFTILAQPGVRVHHELSESDFGLVIASPTEKISRPILI